MLRYSRTSSLLAVLLLAVLLAAGGWWWLRREPAGPAGDADNTMQILVPTAMTVTPRVHMLGRLRPSVAYVVETKEGLILIDAGLESSAESVQAQFKELNLDITRLKLILLTHMHADHVLGARKLRELTGAKLYCGKGDAGPLRAGGPHEALMSTYELPDVQLHPTEIDVELSGGETLTLGEVRVEAMATPGHTPGSMCYLVHLGDRRVLFSGDTVSSFVGEFGTYSAYLPPRYFGNAHDYLDSLRRLKSLPTPHVVLTGHPTELGIPHSPFVNEGSWHQVLDRGIQEMEVLAKRLSDDGADFLDGEAKQLLPGLYYLGDREEHAVYVLITATHQLLFDAPGGPGLAEFVDERLRALGVDSPQITAVLLTSSSPLATSGLAALVQQTPCTVVGGNLAAIKTLCPPDTRIVSAADPEVTNWFRGQVLPLEGRNTSPVAYLIQMEPGKVLIGGEFPPTLGEASVQRLRTDVEQKEADVELLKRSLVLLRRTQPRLWLPAFPLKGQNANLYEGQWDKVIEDLLRFLE